MEVTRLDLNRCDSLGKVLNRAEVKIEGALEAMALSQVITWVNELHAKLSAEVTSQEAKMQEETAQAIQEFQRKKETEEKKREEKLAKALALLDSTEKVSAKVRKIK
jgi:glutaredoxin 2